MSLSAQQAEAMDAVKLWLDDPDKQVFRLFGYAGTGKTTIAKEVDAFVGGEVLFAAFTGKAALVLQEKGCPAGTIHRLIYLPSSKCTQRLEDLEMELAEAVSDDPSNLDLINNIKEEIDQENERAKKPSFTKNPDSNLKDAALLVVDEVSMVGKTMAMDLLSYGRKILVLGDPAQLPPVGEAGFFTNREPDFMLTEIHRQAAGSPVLQLATKVRQGEGLEQGDYGDSRVIGRGVLDIAAVSRNFDQILVGTNRCRHDLNRQVRAELGFTSHLPEEGDKLVCLRNDYDRGLLNGSQWNVLSSQLMTPDVISMDIVDDNGFVLCVQAWTHFFESREKDLRPWDVKTFLSFDFAYAMTVHKSQGSSWPRVLVIDESAVFRADASKHLYTAVTRAKESVTVVQK